MEPVALVENPLWMACRKTFAATALKFVRSVRMLLAMGLVNNVNKGNKQCL